MKRLLCLTLVFVLLSGCAGQTSPETEPTVQTTAEPTQPGLYVPSALEEQTQGAVRQYDLGRTGYYGLAAVGDRLLLLSGADQTQLELLSGEDCVPAESVVLPTDLRTSNWQPTYNGFSYYDSQNRQAVYLDMQLQEADRIALPEDMQGMPAFAPDGSEIFYCVGQEIRGLDTERGLSRLIKSHSCQSQTLQSSFFEGRVVLCSAESKTGAQSTLYISTENGGTRSSDDGIVQLNTFEDRYLTLRMDGITRQWIYGTMDGTPQQLNVQQERLVAARELGGAVGLETDESGNLVLSFYDLSVGKKTAAVSLPQVGEPVAILADRWSGCFWLLTAGNQEVSQKLLRWDVKASAVEEETVYAGAVYTMEAPDEAGLVSLQERVDALNKANGITIRIWQEAVKTPAGHTLVPEHQTSAIGECLDRLEQVLAMFPENFLYKSVNSRIRVCIVRSADEETEAVRYWDNGDAFVVLPVGVDVENAFIQAIGYIVDSHILGNSPMLDAWESLNPEGFAYGSDTQWSADYLEGGTRAFVDGQSMNSVSDDRARIFWQAMQKDNAVMFESQIMQAKLMLLCQSIRDAWRLERKAETYIWEQYLTQSIAYQG